MCCCFLHHLESIHCKRMKRVACDINELDQKKTGKNRTQNRRKKNTRGIHQLGGFAAHHRWFLDSSWTMCAPVISSCSVSIQQQPPLIPQPVAKAGSQTSLARMSYQLQHPASLPLGIRSIDRYLKRQLKLPIGSGLLTYPPSSLQKSNFTEPTLSSILLFKVSCALGYPNNLKVRLVYCGTLFSDIMQFKYWRKKMDSLSNRCSQILT